jgi:hypothetical protein
MTGNDCRRKMITLRLTEAEYEAAQVVLSHL